MLIDSKNLSKQELEMMESNEKQQSKENWIFFHDLYILGKKINIMHLKSE